jgi:hypothetical protein
MQLFLSRASHRWDCDGLCPDDDQAAFHGYTASDYEEAIKVLLARGLVEAEERPGTYRVTKPGQMLCDAFEQLTGSLFYVPGPASPRAKSWNCVAFSLD